MLEANPAVDLLGHFRLSDHEVVVDGYCCLEKSAGLDGQFDDLWPAPLVTDAIDLAILTEWRGVQ